MEGQNELQTLMGHLGEFGKYQAFQFTLHILSALTAGMHMLSLVTVAAVPDHRCQIPQIDMNGSFSEFNATDLDMWIPSTSSGMESCKMFTNGTNSSLTTCSSGWVYDTTYYQSSRAMEWDFVCSKRWMGAVAQTMYMFGVFFGAVTLGGLADKVGRKPIYCWSALLQLIIGVGVAFVPEYYSFLVVRFVYGIFGSAGSYITGFVLTMELVGPSYRTVCGIAFQAVFAFGIMLVAAWGALIKDRMWLQVVYGLHGLLFIGHWWLMDESPSWLWAQGRVREAVKIIQKGLKWNGSNVKLDISQYTQSAKANIQKEDNNKESAGVSDLFKTPNLRKKTLNVCLCWFANSLVYYGLSLNAGKLAGNPFLILFLIGLVEMPSYVLTVLLMDRTGRRGLISFYMLTGGVCCIVAAYMIQGSTAATTIVMFGKFFIASSFAIIYNYSAELFPTVVRNSALGIGSMCARASGALTPLITLLDSFDPTLPSVIFAVIALVSGFLTLFLPETMGQPMPQTIEDGEKFGVGDNCFTACCGKNVKRNSIAISENMQPMDNIR
ncbi:uncharacterized protein CBL_07597 [Carabus blaptoides fortunei]